MARHIHPLTFGPAGACDACGRLCFTLVEVGARCYHCGQGAFMHRQFWLYTFCPVCGGDRCEQCHHKGIVAEPSPDLELDALAEAWESLDEDLRPGCT